MRNRLMLAGDSASTSSFSSHVEESNNWTGWVFAIAQKPPHSGLYIMSSTKLIPLALLLAGSLWGLYSYAQQPREIDTVAATGPAVPHQGRTEALAGPRIPPLSGDTSIVPFSWMADSLEERFASDSAAVQAARVDPGILIYTDPPSGTDMPTLTLPENVDPEMVRPGEPVARRNDWGGEGLLGTPVH